MVSAFASDLRLVLAQMKVDEKSNEITAIPKMLELLDIKGYIVTIVRGTLFLTYAYTYRSAFAYVSACTCSCVLTLASARLN